jgi:hypothetical protein
MVGDRSRVRGRGDDLGEASSRVDATRDRVRAAVGEGRAQAQQKEEEIRTKLEGRPSSYR